MNSSPALQRLVLVIALMLLLGLAWTGINGGYNLLAPSHSPGQKVQAITQIAFGFFALLCALTTFRARRWQGVSLVVFAVTLAFAAGLFVVAWNHASVVVGVLAGALALLIAWGILWLLRLGARGLTGA